MKTKCLLSLLFCFASLVFAQTEEAFEPFSKLTEFGVSLNRIKVNLGTAAEWDYRLSSEFSLRNPADTERLSLELGYDNLLNGFIYSTGLFANLGYLFPIGQSGTTLELRAGLFSLDETDDGVDAMALQVKAAVTTNDTLELETLAFTLNSDTEIALFALAGQNDWFASAKTRVGISQLELDAFDFGVQGQQLDLYASVTPILSTTSTSLYADIQYFLPLETGTLGFRLVAGHQPELVANLEAKNNLSAIVFTSYRYSLPVQLSFLEEQGIRLRRLSLSPRVGLYVDEFLGVTADLAVSLDVISFDKKPLSVFGQVGYAGGNGFYIMGGLSLGY